MAKKSGFATQLVKGFVRSAVNQVGRDGGRVISNQIYGNSYSAPIRTTNGYTLSNSQGADLNISDDVVERVGIEKNTMSTGKMIFMILIGLICAPISSVIFIVMGITKIGAKAETTFVKLPTPMGLLPFPASQKVIDAIHKSGKFYLILGLVSSIWIVSVLLSE